ncbi:MAG: CHASE3 domain-containing protein, partial [Verrucomicrobiota bacterium]
MSFIASAESHQREYLLTGNEVHLKNIPFDVAQAYSEKAFLKELTTDNFEQQNSLQLMEPFIVERLKLLNTAIDYRKKKQITEALAQVKSGHGKEIMRSIQDLIDHMDQEESRLLVIRQEKLAHTVQKNKYLLYFLLSLELPFVLAFIYLVYRLFESVDFNQKIISKTTQGLLVYGPTGSCISMNQAAESILKIHRVEYQLLNFHQIEFWSQSRLLPVAKMTLDQKGSNELEIDYQTQDGESKRLHFSLTHFMSSGKSHLLVLIDDLTPFRREKDALTLAKLEAEKTSRFKDEFLANMSHEIRT